jgi:hypothetical protein
VSVLREGAEQREQVPGEALGHGRVEAARVVDDAERDVVVGGQTHDGDRVVRAEGGPELAHAHVPDAREHGLVEGVVLEGEDALEQRLAAGDLAPGLDLDEGAVFVLGELGLFVLERGEPAEGGEPGRELGAHGHHVDAHADDALQAWHRGGAAGHGGAETHVLFARVAHEQQRPRRAHQRGDGELLLPREGEQALGGVGAEGHGLFGEGGGGVLIGHRVIDAIRRGRSETLEPPAPEGLGLLHVLAAEPLDVVAEGPGPRQTGLQALPVAVVEREQVLHQDRQGPTVEDQVVEAPQEAVRPLPHTKERKTLGRRAVELEADGFVFLDERGETRGLRLGREGAQVLAVERQRRRLQHDLQRLFQAFPEEHRAQDPVALGERAEGPLEGGPVQRVAQDAVDLLQVHLRLRVVEGVKQHPMLHG